MKTLFTSIVVAFLTLPLAFGQNDVTINASDSWIGYMNVFNLDGGYEFGSAWAVPDLKSTLDVDANTLILQPNFNTYNATDEYWVIQGTGEGNKVMEALTFVEPGADFNGQNLTFSGTVQSYTLDTAYTVKYFIKALDPNADYADALGGSAIFDLPESGTFSASVTADQLTAGLVIQYGFSVTGRNANPDNEATLGSVTLGAAPVSVNDLDALAAKVSIYPNPAIDQLTIQSDAPVQSYQVRTLLGQTLLNKAGSRQVDVSTLAAGTYFLTVQTAEGQRTMKFFKR